MSVSICFCRDWEFGIDQMVAQQRFCDNQSGAPKYAGPKFVFCPWCGTKLQEPKLCPECNEVLIPATALMCSECIPF